MVVAKRRSKLETDARCKVVVTFGELAGADGNQIIGLEAPGNFGNQEGCFGDVEWKERLNTVEGE